MINGQLYKQTFGGFYLRRLNKKKAQYVLDELHEGVCNNHLEERTLALQAHSQVYYYPTMKTNAKAYKRKCDKCHKYAPIP